ncbi:lytic murein transglycosylase [Magnetospirillum gryphiswaldense]|uniref:Membrane-bound lytic murein transglycosylase B n=2 Tax=Magnetospirillum gryphiswaldense TaxID=55518 RepID=V6F241_MAGGM|nr:lytic murein transglycosylase [Magnetospirillum gryphiswaldense]AVM73638.1 Membrane-bound lytic murein transglycosylase B precursor [Magnetospirillum gryphiswaldense MSR-1]AVM77541.1 Membrane-bound lytic murein transglycosylase B precursor [Magnetospirillum gryphiswaldense]CAM76692.1 Membrane-bound lytic murein transglycosylase B [Magnetospirillum gryphiswaldense MSR-1]CDK98341.1 putative Membrane-bound lytic murein transglycosylase B [Magnetospirillum gryphiswaldense MSR-1 v2]
MTTLAKLAQAGYLACGLLLLAGPVMAQEKAVPDFATFLQGVKAEAAGKGMRPETLETALANVEHIDKVIELDRRQPEFTMTYKTYMDRVVSPTKVEKGRLMLAENHAVLAHIEREYGVQPKYVVALWGIETDYGRVTGGYSVVSALATLAYDGRRSTYFRGELMNALQILDEGHIAPASMLGSWAGAMGQCQFMPSSFLRFAADWDGDGRRDIWTTRADVLASAANYLSKSGWKGDQTWGRAVKLPAGFDKSLVGLDTRKPLADWAKLGVTSTGGKPLPKADLEASLVMPDRGDGAAFLVYDNFRTTLKWNRSTFFALAVGHLAERIGGK